MSQPKHVYYSDGSHCIEFAGTRGDKAQYSSVAIHPAGFLALTDYYSGQVWNGDKAAIPEGGAVFKVERVTHNVDQTVSQHKIDSVKERPSAEAMQIFQDCDNAYDETVPYAYEKFPEYQEQLRQHAKMYGREKAVKP